MTNQPERWGAVGEAITAAMADLPETHAELAARMGISETKLRALRAGQPDNYRAATLSKVSAALWGRGDVLRRVLDGEDPPDRASGSAVEAAIRADPLLSETGKLMLLSSYRALVETSATLSS